MALLLALLLTFPSTALAGHEGEHAQIARATARIAAAPEAGAPYLHRARLHREHGDLSSCAADLAIAAGRLGETLPVRMERIELRIAEGRWEDAHPMVESTLADLPSGSVASTHGRTLRLLEIHAEVLQELDRTQEAVLAWARLLAVHPEPTPGMYLARAALQPPAEALSGLEQGLKRLKGCVSLELAAVAQEEALGRIDEAVARLQRLVDASQRKETWLTAQGELLLRGGRPMEAREILLKAQAAWRSLPPSKQETFSMRALETRLSKALLEVGP